MMSSNEMREVFGVEKENGGLVTKESALSEKTPIQIGFMISALVMVVGAIWWAATMQSKMDQLIDEVKSARVVQTKVSDSETRIKIIEMRLLQLESAPKKP